MEPWATDIDAYHNFIYVAVNCPWFRFSAVVGVLIMHRWRLRLPLDAAGILIDVLADRVERRRDTCLALGSHFTRLGPAPQPLPPTSDILDGQRLNIDLELLYAGVPLHLMDSPLRVGGVMSFDLSFQFTKRTGADGRQLNCIRARCHKCGHETTIPSGQGRTAVEYVTNRFRKLGWEFDGYHPNRCLCPACTGNTPIETEEKAMVKTNGAIVIAPPQTAAALTPLQKRILKELVQFFDDAAGRFTGERSDQSIADELGCARNEVVAVREGCLGPLQGDPDIDQLRADLEAARASCGGLEGKLKENGDLLAMVSEEFQKTKEIYGKTKTDIDVLFRRLERLEKRLGLS